MVILYHAIDINKGWGATYANNKVLIVFIPPIFITDCGVILLLQLSSISWNKIENVRGSKKASSTNFKHLFLIT